MLKTYENTIIKFGDGDIINFIEFFYSNFPGFTAYANKYISNINVCEDIVQDIFIRFWEKQKSFLSLNAVKVFFYKSIRNACFDYLKHSKIEEKYIQLKYTDTETTEYFFDEIVRIEAYKEIYKEVDKLPQMEKKVLLLALEEKTNEEIAHSLGIKINTVKTHKSRAYKVLRKNLNDLILLLFSFKKSHNPNKK